MIKQEDAFSGNSAVLGTVRAGNVTHVQKLL